MPHEESGYFYVPTALIDDMTLTGTEKLVLISLLSHYDSEWYRAYPTQGEIGEEACLSRPTVIRTLKGLEARGVIQVEREPGYASMYKIMDPKYRPLGE